MGDGRWKVEECTHFSDLLLGLDYVNVKRLMSLQARSERPKGPEAISTDRCPGRAHKVHKEMYTLTKSLSDAGHSPNLEYGPWLQTAQFHH